MQIRKRGSYIHCLRRIKKEDGGYSHKTLGSFKLHGATSDNIPKDLVMLFTRKEHAQLQDWLDAKQDKILKTKKAKNPYNWTLQEIKQMIDSYVGRTEVLAKAGFGPEAATKVLVEVADEIPNFHVTKEEGVQIWAAIDMLTSALTEAGLSKKSLKDLLHEEKEVK